MVIHIPLIHNQLKSVCHLFDKKFEKPKLLGNDIYNMIALLYLFNKIFINE